MLFVTAAALNILSCIPTISPFLFVSELLPHCKVIALITLIAYSIKASIDNMLNIRKELHRSHTGNLRQFHDWELKIL